MGALLCALLLMQSLAGVGISSPPVVAAMQDSAVHGLFDPAASFASFTVHTRWLAAMTGRFDALDGTMETLPDGRLQVQIALRAASVTFPDNERTTRWTRSDAFFDVAQYPVIRFRSEAFPQARLGAGGVLDGFLELRGVRKPVRFVLAKSSCAQPGVACPIHATGRVSRREFGMTRMQLLVRDNVEFTFDALLRAP